MSLLIRTDAFPAKKPTFHSQGMVNAKLQKDTPSIEKQPQFSGQQQKDVVHKVR